MKEFFAKKIVKKTCLSEADLTELTSLLGNGFSIQEALHVGCTKRNEKIFHLLLILLEQGKDAEEVFLKYLPKQMSSYYEGFIEYMSLVDTLRAVLSIHQSAKKQKEQLIKGLLYPCLLFFGVNAGILAFHSFVLPTMLSLVQSFSTDAHQILMMQNVLQFISKSIFVISVILAGACLYFLQESQIRKTYRMVMKYNNNSLLVRYASSEFCRFYLVCLKRKVSTQNALQVLMKLEHSPLVTEIATQLDSYLKNGITFQQAIQQCSIEPSLIQIFQIAYLSDDCDRYVEGYLEMVEKRNGKDIARFSRIVQMTSYCAVGIVLVLVYQVLLIPLAMLEGI